MAPVRVNSEPFLRLWGRLQRTIERELKHAQDIAQMHFLPKR